MGFRLFVAVWNTLCRLQEWFEKTPKVICKMVSKFAGETLSFYLYTYLLVLIKILHHGFSWLFQLIYLSVHTCTFLNFLCLCIAYRSLIFILICYVLFDYPSLFIQSNCDEKKNHCPYIKENCYSFFPNGIIIQSHTCLTYIITLRVIKSLENPQINKYQFSSVWIYFYAQF